MKVVFMGTPDFAVPVLQRLINEHQVICVYTRAPKPSGRGNRLTPSPVQQLAEQHGIPVRTPKTLRDPEAQEAFRALNADIAIVAAYGLILPKQIIEAFPLKCLNVHASLLPRWRGAAPIQRCIEAGDNQSGVSIMQIVEALDAGAVYKTRTTPITASTTGGMLHDKLAAIGADLMSEVLTDFAAITPQPQDENLVTYAEKLSKEEAKLDFNTDAVVLERRIRAFNPFPAAYFEYEGERFKILSAEVIEQPGPTGRLCVSENDLVINCAHNSLRLLEIQRQGKKAMPTAELLRGFKPVDGTILK